MPAVPSNRLCFDNERRTHDSAMPDGMGGGVSAAPALLVRAHVRSGGRVAMSLAAERASAREAG